MHPKTFLIFTTPLIIIHILIERYLYRRLILTIFLEQPPSQHNYHNHHNHHYPRRIHLKRQILILHVTICLWSHIWGSYYSGTTSSLLLSILYVADIHLCLTTVLLLFMDFLSWMLFRLLSPWKMFPVVDDDDSKKKMEGKKTTKRIVTKLRTNLSSWSHKQTTARMSLFTSFLIIACGWCYHSSPSSSSSSDSVLKTVVIPITTLSPSFHNFKILMISDLHLGPTVSPSSHLREVVHIINSRNADIVVIVGDLVDGTTSQLNPEIWLDPLKYLKTKRTFWVSGNHEHKHGDVGGWKRALEEVANVTTLMNERVRLYASDFHNDVMKQKKEEEEEEALDIAGVMDLSAGSFYDYEGLGRWDLQAALRGTLKEEGSTTRRRRTNKQEERRQERVIPLILLAHQPKHAIEASKFDGIDLQLSGHTHGGQVWPFTWAAWLGNPYFVGLYDVKNDHDDQYTRRMQVYVSSGTFWWGPPLRFGSSREITEIILTKR